MPGKMIMTVFAGIAEFERDLIRERTTAGRVAAKGRGGQVRTAPEAESGIRPSLPNGCSTKASWPV